MIQSNLAVTAVYPKRLVILAVVCFLSLANFASKVLGFRTRCLKNDVSSSALDWSTLEMYVGLLLVSPVFAWLFYRRISGLRFLSVAGSGCLLMSYIVMVLSVHFPRLFPLMITTSLLQGTALLLRAALHLQV